MECTYSTRPKGKGRIRHQNGSLIAHNYMNKNKQFMLSLSIVFSILQLKSPFTQSFPLYPIFHFHVKFIALEFCLFFDVEFPSSLWPPSLLPSFYGAFDGKGASHHMSESLQFTFTEFCCIVLKASMIVSSSHTCTKPTLNK